MKHSLILASVLSGWCLAINCHGAGAQGMGEAVCDIQAQGAAACDGQRVRVEAVAWRHPQQHPLLTIDQHESYWEVQGRTWIFISAESLPCANAISAIGVLRARVGPCDPNAQNKNQYCGTALKVESYVCR